MNEQSRGSFKPEWKVDKMFPEGDVIAVVTKSNHATPHYSIAVKFKGRDGQPVPTLAIYADSGVVTTQLPLEDIQKALFAAWNHVSNGVEYDAAEAQAKRPPQRTQGAEGRPGLKALSKRDRADWEAKGRPERRRG